MEIYRTPILVFGTTRTRTSKKNCEHNNATICIYSRITMYSRKTKKTYRNEIELG